MSQEPKLVLVLNDTHCGSDLGLHPEKVILGDGRHLTFGDNLKLQFLWKSWLDMRERFFRLAKNDPYTLVLNGDLIEGFHHKSDSVVAAKISQHLDIAKEALAPFIEMAETVYATRGTECHTEDWESYFTSLFGLAPAKDIQQFTVNGLLVDARHHLSCASSVSSESAALARVMANAIANCARAEHAIPQIFLRAHRHTTGDYCDGHNMIVVPGAWQFMSRYCYKVVGESIPRFSAYALDFRDQPEGAMPARHCFCYTPPFEVLNS